MMDMRSERIKPTMYVFRAPKRSSSRICINSENGKTIYKEDCWHLYSWSDDILTKFHGDNPKAMTFVWWATPLNDFMKINSDGAFSTYHRRSIASTDGLEIRRVHFLSLIEFGRDVAVDANGDDRTFNKSRCQWCLSLIEFGRDVAEEVPQILTGR
ncbi:hypothetical protein VNO78_27051 [Psophocarpus tetragonolobus]|uniref:Uncharacterized protein n=1 Tax=Psophocarpus tetragonolobus TaxID=3891 RepID=A0AAN9XAM3_PSOTE